jgi:hypothetical protein
MKGIPLPHSGQPSQLVIGAHGRNAQFLPTVARNALVRPPPFSVLVSEPVAIRVQMFLAYNLCRDVKNEECVCVFLTVGLLTADLRLCIRCQYVQYVTRRYTQHSVVRLCCDSYFITSAQKNLATAE